MSKTPKEKGRSAQHMRESALSHLADEYKDALQLTGELRRAIDAFSGPIPEDSPQRYLRMDVGDAILHFLGLQQKPKGKSVDELVRELQSRGCLFGVVKTPREIVTKVVKAYVQSGRLTWMDRKQSLVGLPDWKR